MSQSSEISLSKMLDRAVKIGASDLHIAALESPAYRVKGEIQRSGFPTLSKLAVRQLADHLMTDKQRSHFNRQLSVDFQFSFKGLARFRTNIFTQVNGVSIVLRRIPSQVKSLRDLGTPPVLEQIADMRRGLILVTGATGSGKTTTIAAIVEHINTNRSEHIITVEEPIEYIYKPKRCVISQREIGVHAHRFSSALRDAMREDPDVIVVGEMRDLETISLALSAAETGHLVLGTLHTNNCMETVDRIIDAYPTEEQRRIRIMLSNSLQAVVSQTLANRADGDGRLAVAEIMIVTAAVRNLIRENKSHQIPSMLDTNRAIGMQSIETAIDKALQRNFISPNEAESLRKRMRVTKMKRLR